MILKAAYLLAMKRDDEPVRNGAVAIRGGIITDVGTTDSVVIRNPSLPVHSWHHGVLIPGLVNVHTHLELPPLLRKIAASSFTDWVLNLIACKRGLPPVQYERAAKTNIKTLIETGTTTVGEICTHDVSPSLLKKNGLRANVFREIISMEPRTGRALTRLLSVPRSSRLLTYGLSPHSPYTVSREVLKTVAERARKSHMQISVHMAESSDELRLLQGRRSSLQRIYACAKWDLDWAPRGHSSFDYLNNIGMLSPHFLAVHAVHVDDNDIRFMQKTSTAVAHCPRSNKELGVGRMPLKKMLDAGITVGLGTDSLASVSSLNLWDEMRYAFKIHRKDGVTPEDVFSLATIGGAKALGLEGEIGTLTTGKKADIIAVPLPRKYTGDLYYDLLRETKSSIMTMVNGKILYLKP